MKKILLLIVLLIVFVYVYDRYNPFGHKIFSSKKDVAKNAEVAKEQKPLTAQDFFAIGNKKLKNKNFKGAISDFTKAIKLKPDFINAYTKRALAKDSIGDYSGAQKDYDYVILLHSDLNKEKNNENYKKMTQIILKGNEFLKEKKYHEALYEFKEAVDAYPQYAEGYIRRGDTNYLLKNYKEALADYNNAIRIASNIMLYLKRANTKYNLKQYKEAIEDYKIFLKENPTYVRAYYNLLGSYIFLEDFENALKAANQYKETSLQQNIKIDDYNTWMSILNKYTENETTRDLKKALIELKITK